MRGVQTAAFFVLAEAIKHLLDDLDELDIKEDGGRTLSRAAVNGTEAVVRMLLKKGADVDSQDGNKRTPLWLAAWYGKQEMIQILLENTANIHFVPYYGFAQADYVVEWGSIGGHQYYTNLRVHASPGNSFPPEKVGFQAEEAISMMQGRDDGDMSWNSLCNLRDNNDH